MKKVKHDRIDKKENSLIIRKARIGDVKKMHKILAACTTEGTVLPRSLSELYDQLRDFIVATEPGDGPIVGTCAMHICWDDIAEIRSLAVVEGYQRAGTGTALVKACIEEARQLEVDRIFVLTYAVKFFKKIGFKKVDKAVLPHKVWSDCIKCVKFPDCDEEAMLLQLTRQKPS
jgi:amino-acid N-acetyltransferase